MFCTLVQIHEFTLYSNEHTCTLAKGKVILIPSNLEHEHTTVKHVYNEVLGTSKFTFKLL